MNDSATQLVQLIREIVREELKDKDSTALFIVRQKNSNETYNISIYPDLDTVFYNIPNASKYDFDVGDMGVLYKLNNKPNNSFIINKFNYYNSLSSPPKTLSNSYYVEQVSPTLSEQFRLNFSEYYESQCQGISNGWSLCKIVFEKAVSVKLACISNGESSRDYGIIGNINQILSSDNGDDGATGTTKVNKNFRNESSTDIKYLEFGQVNKGDFIMCKYIKDGSIDSSNDSLQFKVII